MKEAFVYSWKNKTTGKIYVGWHKGFEYDGYVCSSKVLMEEYTANPDNFERFIIAHGTAEDMAALETAIGANRAAGWKGAFGSGSESAGNLFSNKQMLDAMMALYNNPESQKTLKGFRLFGK